MRVLIKGAIINLNSLKIYMRGILDKTTAEEEGMLYENN